MHVLVLHTGVRAAVICWDGDNEVQQAFLLGILGSIWAAVSPRKPLHGTRGFRGATRTREGVSVVVLPGKFDWCAIMR